MKNVNVKIVALIGMGLFSLGSCKTNPIERLVNPLPDGVVPQSSGQFVIFDEEVKTGGGIGFIPGGQNQGIDVADGSSPARTKRAIRYHWTGGDVFDADSGEFQHLFAGFSMLVSPDFEDFDSTPGKDLTAPAYSELRFYIRGSLSAQTKVRIEGPDDGDGGITPLRVESGTDFTLSSNWQEVRIQLIPSSHFSEVKVFLTVSLQYDQPPRTTPAGNGGVICAAP